MLPSILKGTVCVHPNCARPRHIPQTQWRCPPKINLDSDWHVAAGEGSTEAVSQRQDTTDPRPSAPVYMTSYNDDNKTPVIPLNPIEVEEEGSLQNSSSVAFLTTNSIKGMKQKGVLRSGTPVPDNINSAESVKRTDVENPENCKSSALGGDMMAVAMAGAAAALTSFASRQDEQTSIDIGLLMQFLRNPDTVHKLISEQSVRGIEPASMLNKPALSVPFASTNSDQSKLNTNNNCVSATTGVIISKPDARTSLGSIQSSRPEHGAIDIDLLARLLRNPKVIEELIKESDAFDRSGGLSASMIMKTAVDQSPLAIAIKSEPLLSCVNTVGEDSSSPTISGVPFSVPHVIFSSVFTASTKMSIIDKELPPLETTMAPMSPLYSSPSVNMEPGAMKIERIDGGVANGMRTEPRLRTRLMSPVVSFSSPQLSGLPRASIQPNVLQSFLQKRPVSPEVHPHPVLRVSAPVAMPETKLMSSLGLVPCPRTEFTLPKANSELVANVGPLPLAFRHPNCLMQAVAHPENNGYCISDKTGHGGFGFPGTSFQPTANLLRSFQQVNPVSPEVYPRPVLRASDPVCMPVTKFMTSLGLDPSPRAELFMLPKVNSQSAAEMRPLPLAFSHTNPFLQAVSIPENRTSFFSEETEQHKGMQRTLDNGFSSSHNNAQVVGQGLSLPKPPKPCIYFNTPRGCWNGTSCPYMHIKSEQLAPSRVEALHTAKRMKLGWETTGRM